jgi:hypothetical protein
MPWSASPSRTPCGAAFQRASAAAVIASVPGSTGAWAGLTPSSAGTGTGSQYVQPGRAGGACGEGNAGRSGGG